MQRTLRELLDESFSVADLTTLCYDLGLVYEALGGESKPARVVALLQWAGQRGRLGDLMLAGRRLRSDLDWDDLSSLCYDLGLVYEELKGESKPARVVALLQWVG